MAASFIPDGARVLEIGAGTGTFRELIQHRCTYTGADLQPLSKDILSLDLDNDPLPRGDFNYIVLLVAFEYLFNFEHVFRKLTDLVDQIAISYFFSNPELSAGAILDIRSNRGWQNAFNLSEIDALFRKYDFSRGMQTSLNGADDFEQLVMTYKRAAAI